MFPPYIPVYSLCLLSLKEADFNEKLGCCKSIRKKEVWNGNKNSSGRKFAARISQLWQIWIKSPNILLLRSQAVICKWNNQVFSELCVTKGKQGMVEMKSSQFAHYQKVSRRETPPWMLYWNHSEIFRANVFSEHLKIACFNDIFCSIESALFTFE